MATKRPLILGVGNPYRSDDGAGRAVAQRLRTVCGDRCDIHEASGEGTALMQAWKDADTVILIDAVQAQSAPGTVYRFDAHRDALPADFFHYSTHAFSVAEAIELARVLGTLPPKLIVYGIEGASWTAGTALSPPVAAAASDVVRQVQEDVSRA